MSAFAREVELSLLVHQQGEEIIKLRAENEALKLQIKRISNDLYANHNESIAKRLYAALRGED